MANGIVPSTQENQSPSTFKERDAQTRINLSYKARWYQQEAVNAILNYEGYKDGGHPLIICPTGSGKSHILGMVCKQILTQWPDQRILVLTHVDTIIKQDYLAIREHLPPTMVGIYSAGVGKKERRKVTVAGIQSIHKKHNLFTGTTIIFIDEAHTVPHTGEGQYRAFLSKFNCPVVGLTATHFRLKTGYLHKGEGRLFTDIAYDVDIVKLIEQGYLCKLLPRHPSYGIDTEGVHTQGGEFVRKEVVERVNREGLTENIVTEMVKYKDQYKKWLIFAIDIEHANTVCALLNKHGITSAVVHSKQTKKTNDTLKLQYTRGDFQSLVSVETLTTGFDEPSIDLIALLRPTKSPVLHIQMIGRGLRIHPSKEHCLVLDFAGNIQRLGPINDVQVQGRVKKKKGGMAITKTCPQCQTIHAGAVKVCDICGHVFEFKEKLKDTAANKDIITKKKRKKKQPAVPVWYDVNSVSYQSYTNTRRAITLQIMYRCGLRTFFEYKQFDSNTKASYHAKHWWSYRSQFAGRPPPQSTLEAINRAAGNELRPPKQIKVLEQGKYPEILEYTF